MRSRMKIQHKLRYATLMVIAAVPLSNCYPPPRDYPDTALVTERRATLLENLLLMLPKEQRIQPAAQQEAQWIADTAYKAAAAISRLNDSNFPGWAGNYLVNAGLQDRGLCWHYQHDMYRELRRRPLTYFAIGCCGRDIGTRREHNCVYVSPKVVGWPLAWVLDAWPWNGRLQTFNAWDLDGNQWQDRPDITERLYQYYHEGHELPMEHWLHIVAKRTWYEKMLLGIKPAAYMDSRWPEAWFSQQHRNMLHNIIQGQETHPDSATDY